MSNINEMPIPSGFDVYWEPWVDAYSDESIENAKEAFEKELEEVAEDVDFEEMEDLPFFEKPIKTIITPFGVLPLTENSLASSHFKFWVGHSNFKLLDNYYPIIEACRGVETVDILTPYRFRIGVGKLFRDREVMYAVRKALLGVVKQNESTQ